jgi:hypothetical protein
MPRGGPPTRFSHVRLRYNFALGVSGNGDRVDRVCAHERRKACRRRATYQFESSVTCAAEIGVSPRITRRCERSEIERAEVDHVEGVEVLFAQDLRGERPVGSPHSGRLV